MSKHAFLGLQVEPVLAEDDQDPYYYCMVFLLGLAAEDEDVIHVDHYNSFVNELLEDVIHHCLECCQTIGETKKHDKKLTGLGLSKMPPSTCLPPLSSHCYIPIRCPSW